MNRLASTHAALTSSVLFSESKSPSYSAKSVWFLKLVRNFQVILCSCFIVRVSEEMLQAESIHW